MDIEYTWILSQEKNYRQFTIITYWSVRSSSRREEDGVDEGLLF